MKKLDDPTSIVFPSQLCKSWLIYDLDDKEVCYTNAHGQKAVYPDQRAAIRAAKEFDVGNYVIAPCTLMFVPPIKKNAKKNSKR